MLDGIEIRKGIPIGYSDEIYARGTCPFCRLLVDISDNHMQGSARDVEFWSIITLKGHEVLSTVAEPLYDVKSVDSRPNNLHHEAIYLAMVRTLKPTPMYRYKYHTLFKDMTYIGMIGMNEVDFPRSLTVRNTANASEIPERLRGWLSRCSKHKTCQLRANSRTVRPDGFRLFDITALQVVDSFELEPYIALSYPWAQIDEFEIKRDQSYMIEDIPKVMQDVISLIKELKLGINHIWMDRLCINDDDPIQKTANIDAMGDIYGSAFATMIFAVPARSYIEQGIPGISAPRPPYQRVEKVGNMILATTYPSLDMAITTSQWNLRAWTFQEGLLSSRCILFGPEQSYFECAEMGCNESIQEPDLEASEHDFLIPYKSRLRNPFLDTYDFNSLYWRLVRDYTGRDMKFASDSLHAFAAFVGEFKRAGKKLLWGLPILESALCLLWEHETWDFRDINRRSEFPSWSWAGWSGTAAMNFPLDTDLVMCYNYTMTAESSEGRVLCCKARSAKVSISGQFPLFTISGASSSSIALDCGMNNATEYAAHDCMMMEICTANDFVHGLMVVQKDDVFERIGSGFLKLLDFEAASPIIHDLMLA